MTASAAGLAARAAGLGLSLSEGLSRQLFTYFQLLQRWNRTINLTGLLDSDEGIDRLLLEPVAAARHLPKQAAIADLGSGGGSPAIPLALALGARHLLMVEARSRKAAFLREAARTLELDATVEAARFQDVAARPQHAAQFDVVSIRAVRPDEETLATAEALLNRDGCVALFLGPKPDHAALPPVGNLALRATRPLLPSTGSRLALLFHVEQR